MGPKIKWNKNNTFCNSRKNALTSKSNHSHIGSRFQFSIAVNTLWYLIMMPKEFFFLFLEVIQHLSSYRHIKTLSHIHKLALSSRRVFSYCNTRIFSRCPKIEDSFLVIFWIFTWKNVFLIRNGQCCLLRPNIYVINCLNRLVSKHIQNIYEVNRNWRVCNK